MFERREPPVFSKATASWYHCESGNYGREWRRRSAPRRSRHGEIGLGEAIQRLLGVAGVWYLPSTS